MKIDNLISRLEGVRKVGPFRWKACCPVHEDRTPSLSIRTTPEGLTLLYCFGCGAKGPEILDALNLRLCDVQELQRTVNSQSYGYRPDLSPYRHHFLLLACAAASISQGIPLSDQDTEVLLHTALTLYQAARGGHDV